MSRKPLVWLLIAKPRNPATGAEVTVRLAGGGQTGYKQFGSAGWYAGLEQPPAVVQNLGYTDGQFGEGAVLQAFQMQWSGRKSRVDALAALYWREAPFTLYSGPDGGSDTEFSVVLAGNLADIQTDQARLTLQMVDPSAVLARPLLAGAQFAGTGGIEGVPELKGRAKRRAFGRCMNIELWPLDTAYNIWVATDPARPIQAFDLIKDKGNAASPSLFVAWAGSVTATLDALRAASAPAGGAAVAPSISCIKWWYANPGKLTADIRGEIGAGYIDAPADIAARIISSIGSIAVNAASLIAARALRNYECGLLISDETPAGQLLNELLSGVSLWWGMTSGGELEFGPWQFDGAQGTLNAASAMRIQTHKPVKKLTLGWRTNNLVMSRGDIAGSVLDAAYADGTPIENLRPAQPGATNDANLSDPTQLTINEKMRLIATEATRANRRLALRTRLLAQGLPVAALDQALVDWFVVRNGLSPAWDNITAHSTINRSNWNALSLAYDAALDASDIAISQEDARRSVWDQTTGRPPLLTGDSVTADDTLLDPTVWNNTNCIFTKDVTGEGLVSSVGLAGLYHKAANATPIDFSAAYEACFELMEDGSGQGTNSNYISIIIYDQAGNIITGDAGFWYFRFAGMVGSRGQWEKQSIRFGQGTDLPFPPNAVKFGLELLLNYSNAGIVTSARRLKTRRITKNNFTAAAPYKWTLGDDQLICNIGIGSWENVAYSKSVIAGPQKFTGRFAGPAYVAIMMGLTESTAPASHLAGAGQIYLNGTILRIQEGPDVKAEYPSIPNVRTAEFAIEYDGLRLRYYVNGAVLPYITYVVPGKSYKAFVDTFYAGAGLVNVTHASSQGAAIIGGNTYGFDGEKLTPKRLDNNYNAPGQNLIANSDQTTLSYDVFYNTGITVGYGPVLSNTIFSTADYVLCGSVNNVVVRQAGMSSGGDTGGLFDVSTGQRITVAPGERFVYSVYCAGHRCKQGLYIVWRDSYGAPIGYKDSGPVGLPTDNLANILTSPFYNRLYVVDTVPTGAASAELVVRKYNTLNSSDSYIWFAAPMFERAAPSQTEPSPYQPGAPSSVRHIGYNGDLDADVTAKTQLAIAGVDDITINFDHANNAITSLPRSQGFKVTRGGVDVTATAALTVTVKSGTIAASISGGVLAIDKLGGVLTSAVLELGGAYGTSALPTKTVRITRENAAAPTAPPSTGAGSATADSTAVNGTSNSTTPVAVGREVTVVTGTAGIVTLNANYEFFCGANGTYAAYARWYKWNGSAYIAIGTSVLNNVPFAQSGGTEPYSEAGSGVCNHQDSGNTLGSTQKYKLYMNAASGTVTRTISGNVSATGVNP